MLLEIEMTFMADFSATESHLRSLLDAFEAKHQIRVKLKPMLYSDAWPQVVKFALYGAGPDISQVGSTWISNLVSMNALRPFSDSELAQLGAPAAFLPALWQGGLVPGYNQVWAIPWLGDVRLVFYRRDWLAQAGVEAATAFSTFQHLEQTLACLQASRGLAPWGVPTEPNSQLTLHGLASWVWSNGGDFISPDGKQVLFMQPEALAAIRQYFDLYRYLPPAPRPITEGQLTPLFLKGESAATLNGPWTWLGSEAEQNERSPEVVAANVGVAMPLGVPFAGGEYLVVWKHTRSDRLALKLLQFLTSQPAQTVFPQKAGLLPVRLDLLSDMSFTADSIYQAMGRALPHSRSLTPSPRLGLVEDQLVKALGEIWTVVLSDPKPEVETLIRDRLDPVAKRLNTSLSVTAVH